MSDISPSTGHDSTAAAAAPSASSTPERPSLDGLEAKWDAAWESSKIYTFNRETTRENVFSIDTPPPTASGSLHIGHVFAYTQADVIARYQRMIGKDVFYPMGWDDNGLPTERRVQNYFGVRCDPSLPYVENFEPPHRGATRRPRSRRISSRSPARTSLSCASSLRRKTRRRSSTRSARSAFPWTGTCATRRSIPIARR